MKHPHELHKEGGRKSYRIYIISISTSRYMKKEKNQPYTDESGDLAEKILREKGHKIAGRSLLPDNMILIRREIIDKTAREDIDAIITTGGTGISRTDTTIEAVKPLLTKELEGFGEIFRFESMKEIGYSAIMTRATAGIIENKLIVCLPGSPKAVELGLKIILEEIDHIMNLIK